MTIRRMMMTIRKRMMTIRRRMMTIRRKMMTNRNGRPPKTDRTAIAQSREGENDRLFPLQYIQLRPPYSYFDHQSFPENFCHRMKRFKKHPFNLCTFITSSVTKEHKTYKYSHQIMFRPLTSPAAWSTMIRNILMATN